MLGVVSVCGVVFVVLDVDDDADVDVRSESITYKSAPTNAVSLSLLNHFVITPSPKFIGCFTSTVTLSVSTIATTSPSLTNEPIGFTTFSNVPSVIESPMLGTLMFMEGKRER